MSSLTLAIATNGAPDFWFFVSGLAVMLSMHALLIPNFNTMAMNPMGKLAGTAAAVIGTISTALGAGLGAMLDRAFDGTVLPFTLGFFGCGLVAAGFVTWAGRGRPVEPDASPDEALGRAAVIGG